MNVLSETGDVKNEKEEHIGLTIYQHKYAKIHNLLRDNG
jgi:hypothetical protein